MMSRSLAAAALAAAALVPVPAFAASAGLPVQTDWWEIGLGLLGGLALFLFALGELSRSLDQAAGPRMRCWLGDWGGRPLTGFAAGAGATIALDSSSATIIILIAFVKAGLLTAWQALPAVLGSNVGTTISSQLLAAGLDDFAPLLLAAALLVRAVARLEVVKTWAMVAAMIALLLFGLNLMGAAVEPLAGRPDIKQWLATLGTPLTGILVGAGLTVLLQSSSATMALVLAFASGGLIDLPTALAIMLGAEIGTCADALIASVGRAIEPVKVGLFHLGFNLLSVTIGFILLEPLAGFASWSAGDLERQIANAHLGFNLVGALAALGLLMLAGRLGVASRGTSHQTGGAGHPQWYRRQQQGDDA